MNTNSFGSRATLKVGAKSYEIYRLDALERRGLPIQRLPYSLKILLENLLRREDGHTVRSDDIEKLTRWAPLKLPDEEIAFMPARVLLQDFTGVPAVVDLAAMRDAMVKMGGDPKKVNPLLPAELVIDHSVIVDEFGTATAFQVNADLEFQRYRERYALLRWAQKTFAGFKVVPPDTGLVHQVNLEHPARRSRHDRQHGAGVRRDSRDFPGGPRDPALPRVHRTAARIDAARRGVYEGTGTIP